VPASLMDCLRSDTRSAHRALERQLDLLADDLHLARYLRLIELFYGFYTPLEAQLLSDDRLPWTQLGLDPRVRRKAGWLAADVSALAGSPLAALPLCTDLPDVSAADAAFGCLYVLEGATLGGRVISRHLTRTLGIGPQTGARFHHGYGEDSAAMWRAFQAAGLRHAALGADPEQVVRGANATFEALARWCSGHERSDVFSGRAS